MARVGVYVPDSLKVEMDQIGEAVNWSAAAQSAFNDEILRYKSKGAINMDAAIERLLNSKKAYEKEEIEMGKDDGRHWAMNTAEYRDLKRISDFERRGLFNGMDVDYGVEIARALKLDGPLDEGHPFFDEDEGTCREVTADYGRSWIDGVLEVWSEVESRS